MSDNGIAKASPAGSEIVDIFADIDAHRVTADEAVERLAEGRRKQFGFFDKVLFGLTG